MVKTILGPDAASTVPKVSLSTDTISCPFSDMSCDVDAILREKKNDLRRKFSLQSDESTDISGHAQLIVNIRYIDRDVVRSNFFFCKQLPELATGYESFRVTDEYLRERGLH
jgi:hypothetical protein